MKKWVVLVMMAGILAGCSSGGTEETTKSESTAESTAVMEVSSSEKKIELKEAAFQIEGTPYKIKILDKWAIQPEEETIPFSAREELGVQGIMVYGMKKTDVDGFETFKNGMKEQIVSTEDFQIEEGSAAEADYQTAHYSGSEYSFIGITEGIKIEVQYYLLETDTDYIVVNLIGVPSFFEKNAELITEMMNSFVAG
ncbi:hypothetical protein [Enterococcus pallens]|uniref:PsbP C-terminal domain-containing protein n=1 Tax=Enterococcus pallens ATCC BAA-351 TaxID=1158607 RepID=R2T536_9ENTE|nr:hypothetical protein [Enterococcus pallens]EOH95354.1 hypothetical protein UAU_01316 [Enterococcus pallens ATCC BAA-351]EOU21509.1 hypothetical protein I588_02356 [Enterococcus pallens ATCC BAA-351]OJG79664.1 hypothetical protein RV10_GL000452 [Enterococcus pallens]